LSTCGKPIEYAREPLEVPDPAVLEVRVRPTLAKVLGVQTHGLIKQLAIGIRIVVLGDDVHLALAIRRGEKIAQSKA
jgi:hypothetical protein